MFDQLVEMARAAKPLFDIVGGLGLAAVFGAVLLAFLKRNAHIRQWRNFKDELQIWAEGVIFSKDDRHPKEFSNDEWRAECEEMLDDAQFTPTEISQIMDLAIIVAKRTVIDFADMFDEMFPDKG